ncbi:hypothetical protein [Albibacillus kandeliae]|uniref:hypothetical protein n=1 Tax=Albibacillus kandeliae TaxID=2174228 RepID=UPI000D69FE33|nr:hypothetical protein [Albibacillus kandeliae]
MAFLFRCAAGLALCCLAVPSVAAPERWSVIGNWDISYYSATEGCLAYARFDHTDFFIGFDTREEKPALDLTVLDDRWESIEPDVTYPVTLMFGDEEPWTLDMRGVHMDDSPGLNILIDASMNKAETFIEEFQREMRMSWSYGDTKLGVFTLKGSRSAFQAVLDCQNAHAPQPAPEAEPVPDETEAIAASASADEEIPIEDGSGEDVIEATPAPLTAPK